MRQLVPLVLVGLASFGQAQAPTAPAPTPAMAASVAPTSTGDLNPFVDLFYPGAAWPDLSQTAFKHLGTSTVEGTTHLKGEVDGFQVDVFTVDQKTVAGGILTQPQVIPIGDEAAAQRHIAAMEKVMARMGALVHQPVKTNDEPARTTQLSAGYKSIFYGAKAFYINTGGYRIETRIEFGSKRYYYTILESALPGSITFQFRKG